LQTQTRDDQQAQCTEQTSAQRWQRGIHGGIERLAQSETDDHGQYGEKAQQFADRVGFKDVVQHFVGVHQVIDGDEVEAHAELVPEQPFGHRHEQHGEQADRQQDAQEPAMSATVPHARRAEQQVQAHWQCRVGKKPQVIQRADAERGKGEATGLIQVSQQQNRARQEKNNQPGTGDQQQKAHGRCLERVHRLVFLIAMARECRDATVIRL